MVSHSKASWERRGMSWSRFAGLGLSVGLASVLVWLAIRSDGSDSGGTTMSLVGGATGAARGAARTMTARGGRRLRHSRQGSSGGARVRRATKTCQKGQVVSWRLVTSTPGPRLSLPSLNAAANSLKTWWRIAPDPHAVSLGKAGPYMVGLARPDVDGFIRGRPAPLGRADPGPSFGISEAMTAVLLPPPGSLNVDVSLPKGRVVFQTWAGVVPRGRAGKVRFSFDVRSLDGKPNLAGPAGAGRSASLSGIRPIHEDVELIRARGRWIPVKMDLSRFAGQRVRITITTTGPRAVPMFVADPLVWSESCLPGRNILLVIIDTMRADAFDLIAGRKGVTPNLDALADRGVSFDQARSLGTWTRPSMTAILASDWANHLGVSRTRFRLTRAQRRDIHQRLRTRLSSLYLRRLGYFTEAVGNNFFFLEHTPIGLDRGFERVVDIRGSGGKDSVAAVTELSRFLPQHRHRPFFLWVHLDGAHWPYLPPRGYSVRGARAPGAPRDRAYEDYLGEVRWSDEILGRILALLEKNRLADRTLVAVTADHGETFEEAHCFTMGHIQTRHAHGWSVYEELLHVPLVLSGPGLAKGLRVAHPLSHLHLIPTLLDYAGLPPLPGARGRSLRPVIERSRSAAPSWLWPIVSEGRHMEAIRRGRFKYIRRWGFVTRIRRGRRSETVHDELYDLDADPLETNNLAPHKPDLVERLRREMARILNVRAGHLSGGLPRVLHLGLWTPSAEKVGGHRLVARIQCASGLAMSTVSSGSRARWIGPSKLEVELSSVPKKLIEASVILGCDRATLELSLDGRKVRSDRLRVGPYGLRLLDRYEVIDESVRVAAEAPLGPIDPRSKDVSCYLWTSTAGTDALYGLDGKAPGRPGVDLTGPGSRQVDRLLQQWGYSKDH